MSAWATGRRARALYQTPILFVWSLSTSGIWPLGPTQIAGVRFSAFLLYCRVIGKTRHDDSDVACTHCGDCRVRSLAKPSYVSLTIVFTHWGTPIFVVLFLRKFVDFYVLSSFQNPPVNLLIALASIYTLHIARYRYADRRFYCCACRSTFTLTQGTGSTCDSSTARQTKRSSTWTGEWRHARSCCIALLLESLECAPRACLDAWSRKMTWSIAAWITAGPATSIDA